MRKKLLLFVVIVGGLISVQATAFDVKPTEEDTCATCTGEFKIDGKSYDITLHDVSLWECAKFKVASWFN